MYVAPGQLPNSKEETMLTVSYMNRRRKYFAIADSESLISYFLFYFFSLFSPFCSAQGKWTADDHFHFQQRGHEQHNRQLRFIVSTVDQPIGDDSKCNNDGDTRHHHRDPHSSSSQQFDDEFDIIPSSYPPAIDSKNKKKEEMNSSIAANNLFSSHQEN